MDVKPYIDYFDELADLPREQQFPLLEQAYSDVHAQFKLPVLVIIPHLVRVLVLLLFVGGAYLVFGQSIAALAIAGFVSLLFSRVIATELSDALLRKALRRLLAKA